jgi:adenylate kinase family enzyme
MKKVAVFGNTGGGKSTLAKQLAQRTKLPLYVLDKICFYSGGGNVAPDIYNQRHGEILGQDEWIIEGYGSLDTTWMRLSQADTLVYIDQPFARHFWWVTKRFFKGLFVMPEGWPNGSPLLASTVNSYRNLWLCHKHLTPRYRAYVVKVAESKQVVHLRSPADTARFLASVEPRQDRQATTN